MIYHLILTALGMYALAFIVADVRKWQASKQSAVSGEVTHPNGERGD